MSSGLNRSAREGAYWVFGAGLWIIGGGVQGVGYLENLAFAAVRKGAVGCGGAGWCFTGLLP